MKLLGFALLFCLSFSALADGKVTLFVTLSPAGSFQAVSKKPKGYVFRQGDSVTAERIAVSVESFETGIELRDEHFHKHLNASKHPRTVLSDVSGSNGKAKGTLEVNGIKKPVAISYKFVGNEMHAQFNTKASEFGLKKAEYLGVGVDDNVKVEAVMPFRTK
jgi:polyisoprenoid-binding protein YceI